MSNTDDVPGTGGQKGMRWPFPLSPSVFLSAPLFRLLRTALPFAIPPHPHKEALLPFSPPLLYPNILTLSPKTRKVRSLKKSLHFSHRLKTSLHTPQLRVQKQTSSRHRPPSKRLIHFLAMERQEPGVAQKCQNVCRTLAQSFVQP